MKSDKAGRVMEKALKRWICAVLAGVVFALPPQAWGQQELEMPVLDPETRLITLNFNQVDLPVFIKFISELTERNFIVDEQIKGKITIFSSSMITAST